MQAARNSSIPSPVRAESVRTAAQPASAGGGQRARARAREIALVADGEHGRAVGRGAPRERRLHLAPALAQIDEHDRDVAAAPGLLGEPVERAVQRLRAGLPAGRVDEQELRVRKRRDARAGDCASSAASASRSRASGRRARSAASICPTFGRPSSATTPARCSASGATAHPGARARPSAAARSALRFERPRAAPPGLAFDPRLRP